MSDEDWGDIESVPKKKSGLPKWLWFCGGGCLLAAIVLGIAAWWGVGFIKDSMDPEIVWPKLNKVVQVDQPMPERYELMPSMTMVGQYQVMDRETSLSLQINQPPSNEGPGSEGALFGDEPRFPMFTFQKKETINIQGREIPAVLMVMKLPMSDAEAGVTFLNITPEGGRYTFVQVTPTSTEEIPVDEIKSALSPFHIGPDR